MRLLLVPVRPDAIHAHRVTAAVLGLHTLAFAGAVARSTRDYPGPGGFVPAGTGTTPQEVAAEATLCRAGLWRPAHVEEIGQGYYLDSWDIAVAAMRLVRA
ncbi:hypothetical protein [Parafrankia discariae]|uniref:hypothetical protein n=1 Tax=Parafrankia discariae TaxID=365528 RepID=UPI0003729088|nr:hypothetical protein [Parafrankia discariae]